MIGPQTSQGCQDYSKHFYLYHWNLSNVILLFELVFEFNLEMSFQHLLEFSLIVLMFFWLHTNNLKYNLEYHNSSHYCIVFVHMIVF